MKYRDDVRYLTREDADFYEIMGPIFGSRKITRETNDHFYDDADKKWVCGKGEGDDVDFVFSINGAGILKNLYIANEEAVLEELSLAALNNVVWGNVPIQYKNVLEAAGFEIQDESAKFVMVKGHVMPKPTKKKSAKASDVA